MQTARFSAFPATADDDSGVWVGGESEYRLFVCCEETGQQLRAVQRVRAELDRV